MVTVPVLQVEDINPKVLVDVFNITWREAEILKCLLDNEIAGPNELPKINYSVRQYVYMLRKKLGKSLNVRIVTYHAGHYGLPELDKARLLRIIASRNAGE